MLALSKSDGFRSTTTPSPSPPPDSSSRCALSVSARASLPLHRHPKPKERSAFLSSLATRHSPLTTMFFRITSLQKSKGRDLPTPSQSLFHTEHASDTQHRPQLQSCHAIAHTFRHTWGCTPLVL